MKALVIDDERLAREDLKGLLREHPWIEVCAEAENFTQAVRLIGEQRPDLLFLDIQMPGKSGFDLLQALAPPVPHVIFTTAFDEFALRAFEVNALDYLMKPIHPGRLADALLRMRERLEPAAGAPVRPAAAPPEARLAEDDRVFLREQERCWFVTVKSIRLLESEDDCTRIHFDAERPVLGRSLASMESRLPARLFMRANRAQLVNLAFVEKVEPWFSGSLKVRLRGGPEVEFSRRQAQLFRERLSL